MLYNGFVITDNRAFSNPNIPSYDKWNPNILENGFNSPEESGDYTVPAGPGGGGSTPPSLPFSVTTAGTGTGAGKGGGNWQQYLNPELIGSVVGTVGAVAGAIGKNPDKQRIKAVCGRKPLFNFGGKKDSYRQCVQNLMNPPQQRDFTPPPPAEGLSKTTKIIIGVSVALLLIGIVITVIVLNKNKAKA